MPINPQHLLDLAKRLVGPAPGAVKADLRRGISAVCYALFHLLIKEAMTNFVSDPVFRTKVGRAFQHGSMRSVCDKYNPEKPDKKTRQYITQEGQGFPSQVIAPEVRAIAATFIAVYDAREKADYDDAATVQHAEALTAVQQVELAFQSWLTVQTDASAITFLQELLWRSISSRKTSR
jgi:hypothetical protein